MKNFLRSCCTWALVTWAMIFVPLLARAQQDIQVTGGTNPYTIIGRGLTWGGSGINQVNNNFIFHPTDPNEGFCLFVSNNNTSSSHTFTVAVYQTGDPAQSLFTGFSQRWFLVATNTAFPVTVNANAIVGINYKTTASAGISVNISGSTTQTGSPDTADIFAVQTNQSSCGSLPVNSVQGPYNIGATQTTAQKFPVIIGGTQQGGNSVQQLILGANGGMELEAISGSYWSSNFVSNPLSFFDAPQDTGPARNIMFPVSTWCTVGQKGIVPGCAKTNILEVMTDNGNITAGNQFAWAITGAVSNPGAATLILGDTLAASATVNTAYKTLTLSCSAACELEVVKITTIGTTCTAVTPQPLELIGNGTAPSYNASHVAIQGGCGAQPTIAAGSALFDVQLGASVPYTIDLSGIANRSNVTALSGIAVFEVTALTGKAIASVTVIED